MSVTIELQFERTTKNKVRFAHPDFGTVYVPNADYAALGCPAAITITLEPAPVAELKAA